MFRGGNLEPGIRFPKNLGRLTEIKVQKCLKFKLSLWPSFQHEETYIIEIIFIDFRNKKYLNPFFDILT